MTELGMLLDNELWRIIMCTYVGRNILGPFWSNQVKIMSEGKIVSIDLTAFGIERSALHSASHSCEQAHLQVTFLSDTGGYMIILKLEKKVSIELKRKLNAI